MDVTEVRPSIPRGNAPPAISIIETDIKVDFKEPRDYKEWQKKNKGKNFNTTKKKQESKQNDEEEEDDFGVIVDPIQNAKNSKSDYFQSLERSGIHAQTIKKSKNKSKSKIQTPTSPTNISGFAAASSPINPYSTRGAPLGKSRGKALGSGTGKCEYNKPKYVNGNMAMGRLIKQKSVRKEEEIVGTMRYIYEIDEHGNRNLVRRLPVRNVAASNDPSKGYSLK